jgi:hypothetical protein
LVVDSEYPAPPRGICWGRPGHICPTFTQSPHMPHVASPQSDAESRAGHSNGSCRLSPRGTPGAPLTTGIHFEIGLTLRNALQSCPPRALGARGFRSSQANPRRACTIPGVSGSSCPPFLIFAIRSRLPLAGRLQVLSADSGAEGGICPPAAEIRILPLIASVSGFGITKTQESRNRADG